MSRVANKKLKPISEKEAADRKAFANRVGEEMRKSPDKRYMDFRHAIKRYFDY